MDFHVNSGVSPTLPGRRVDVDTPCLRLHFTVVLSCSTFLPFEYQTVGVFSDGVDQGQ